MVYDENISEDISLCRILDCFIVENEKPSVILDFLLGYDNGTMFRVLDGCSRSLRLFQLDFVHRLSPEELQKFVKICDVLYNESNGINLVPVLRLAWKIKQSNIMSSTKKLFDHFIQKNNRFGHYSVSHPYRGRLGREMSDAETIFKDVDNTIEDIADHFNSMDDKDVAWYFSNMEYSLFADRVFDDDIFLLLDFKVQYLATRGLAKVRRVKYSFFKNVLEWNIDVNLKNMLLNNIETSIGYNEMYLTRDIKDLIYSSETYAEFMMNLQLYGVDSIIRDLIPSLLLLREEFLFEMYNNDRDLIKNNYDICDLIEFRIKNGSK